MEYSVGIFRWQPCSTALYFLELVLCRRNSVLQVRVAMGIAAGIDDPLSGLMRQLEKDIGLLCARKFRFRVKVSQMLW